MKKLILLALMPLFLFACGQRTTTTTVSTNPQTGQQMTTTTTVDDNVNNQNYQVYNGPNGQQYAVTYINGQQQYVPYNIFQQQMALGGYNALNDYYYSNPSYFHPYNTGSFATGFILATALSGSYGNYYSRNHITTYNTYHYYHQPVYRQTSLGSRSTYNQSSNTGMGNRQVQPQSQIRNTSGMGNYRAASSNNFNRSSNSGMGSRSSSSRSGSGMGRH